MQNSARGQLIASLLLAALSNSVLAQDGDEHKRADSQTAQVEAVEVDSPGSDSEIQANAAVDAEVTTGEKGTTNQPDHGTPDIPPAAAPAKPKPRYMNLRFDDDFSYLDGPEDSYQSDFLDPIKNIPLDDDWRLTFGGEIRLRFEAEQNKFLLPGSHQVDNFLLHRTDVFADLKYKKSFRFFIEGIYADVEDRDELLFFIHRNKGDLQQLFFDVKPFGEDTPLTARVGRQEFSYGKERVISPTGWGRVRRRFDAAKLLWKTEKFDLDIWYAKPVIAEEIEGDDWDRLVDFYGLYATYRFMPRHGLDFYALALDDRGNQMNPNGNAGDRDIYTLGTRFFGESIGFDYETEVNGQWGHWAGDTVRSWSAGGGAGYSFAAAPLTPRIGTAFEIAGGDSDPNDEVVGTYEQLYKQERELLGYLVLFGRQNITSLNANLTLWPVPKAVRFDVNYYAYWLTEARDAVYSPGGLPIPSRRDPSGESGVELGNAIDLTLGWQVDVHTSILLGYSRFFADNFIHETGDGDDSSVYYLEYKFQF